MKIIDFRVRPPFGSYLTNNFFSNIPFRKTVAEGKYNMDLAPSCVNASMDMLLQEMDELNIVKGVVPARVMGGMVNSELADFLDIYGDRFWGIASADPLNIAKSLEDIDKYVVNGKAVGVVIEPGFSQEETMAVDDERIYPIYEKCEKENIPMVVAFGGMLHRRLSQMQPVQMDNISLDFPKLKMLMSHGGWPYAQEVTWLALCRPNVYIMPDLYIYNTPGMWDYVAAINTVCKEKVIFGSAYPIVSQKESVAQNMNCGIRGQFLENVFYNNALKFLGKESV